MKICIVEDSKSLLYTLKRLLTQEKYIVRGFTDPQDALKEIRTEEFDLFLIDVNLPNISGYELCAEIRKVHPDKPIVFLTVRDSLEDKIKGFEVGADDYLVKPFASAELIVRIKSILKRKLNNKSEIIKVGDLILDVDSKQIKYIDTTKNPSDIEIPLSLTEFQILEYLMRHSGQSIDKDRIASIIWEDPYELSINLVAVYIGKLRKKLKKFTNNEFIKTVRGFGYRIG